MDIITRAEAKARGLTRYFTGKPCPHGHVVERITNEAKCSKCELERTRKYREANPEKMLEYGRKFREANREKMLEYGRKYRQGGLVEKAKRQRASGA